jgi:hypothetical protein
MYRETEQIQLNNPSFWHHDYLDNLGISKEELENFKGHLHYNLVPFNTIAQNKNVHGDSRFH